MRGKWLVGFAIIFTAFVWSGPASVPALAASDSGSWMGSLPAKSYPYTGVWFGVSESLQLSPNVTVEGLPDAQLVGQVTGFKTSDPTYKCLNQVAINVFLAPKEFPGSYVVHDGLQGSMCVYGTWTFAQGTYTGTWNGRTYSVSQVDNVTVEGLADSSLITYQNNCGSAGQPSCGYPVQLTGFQTTDPRYQCLNGSSINVFMAQSEFPGQHVIHDGLQGPMCRYGSWTFMPLTHYSITLKSFIPQSQLWDPDTSALCALMGEAFAVYNKCGALLYNNENPTFGTTNSDLGALPCNQPSSGSYYVYGLFAGDGHTGYAGSYRTQTVINFDWNPASKTISNFTTSMDHGYSTVTIWYQNTFTGQYTQPCSLSSLNGLQYPYSWTTSSASFTTGTSGYDPFVPGVLNSGNCNGVYPDCGPYADIIDATLTGSFASDGRLTLPWKTDWFPSFGIQVWANQGYNAPQVTSVLLDNSWVNTLTWSPTDFSNGLGYIGESLKYYDALAGTCSPPHDLANGHSTCNSGNTTLLPAP